MHIASIVLLFTGLLLEGTLLAILWRRRLVRHVPLFAGLLFFYVLRGLVLFATAYHTSPAPYAALASALALIDFALQLALAASLFLRVAGSERKGAGSRRLSYRLWMLAAGLFLACGLTMLLVFATPARAPVPLDRETVFCAIFFIALFAFVATHRPTLERSLLQGFAVFGVVQAGSQWGKAMASFHQNPWLFLFWAYLNALTWLLLLILWIRQLSVRPSAHSCDPETTDPRRHGFSPAANNRR